MRRPPLIAVVLSLAGLGLIVYGIARIYPPAAFIAAGAIVVATAALPNWSGDDDRPK